MGADIVEHEDVPLVCEKGGLFYFCRGGKRIKAYRPQSLLLLRNRIDAAYKAWVLKPSTVVPGPTPSPPRKKPPR